MRKLLYILMLFALPTWAQEDVSFVSYESTVILEYSKDSSLKVIDKPLELYFEGNIITVKQGLKKTKYKFVGMQLVCDVNLDSAFFIRMERKKKPYILSIKKDYSMLYLKDYYKEKTLWVSEPTLVNSVTYEAYIEENDTE